MEDITVQKYLRKNNLLIDNFLDLSTSFSSRKVITHFPPRNPKGSQLVLGNVLSYSPEFLFHGHIEEQLSYNVGKTKVISVGSMEKGYYVIYDGRNFELKRTSH